MFLFFSVIFHTILNKMKILSFFFFLFNLFSVIVFLSQFELALNMSWNFKMSFQFSPIKGIIIAILVYFNVAERYRSAFI